MHPAISPFLPGVVRDSARVHRQLNRADNARPYRARRWDRDRHGLTPDVYAVARNHGPANATIRMISALDRRADERLVDYIPPGLAPPELLLGQEEPRKLLVTPYTSWPITIRVDRTDGTGDHRQSRTFPRLPPVS